MKMKQLKLILLMLILSCSLSIADEFNTNCTIIGEGTCSFNVNTTTNINNFNSETKVYNGRNDLDKVTNSLRKANEGRELSYIQYPLLNELYNFVNNYFFIPIAKEINNINKKDIEQDDKLEKLRRRINYIEQHCVMYDYENE